MTLGVLLMVAVSRGEVKLKVGKAVVLLMGREMGGRSGNSGTWIQKINRGLFFPGNTNILLTELKLFIMHRFSRGGFLGRRNCTSSSSCRLEDARIEDLSRFILPPPQVTLLAAGVLDKG